MLHRFQTPHESSKVNPPFCYCTTNIIGEIQLPAEQGMDLPGDNALIHVALDKPIAVDIGSHFAIREGGRTVGSGVVTSVD